MLRPCWRVARRWWVGMRTVESWNVLRSPLFSRSARKRRCDRLERSSDGPVGFRGSSPLFVNQELQAHLSVDGSLAKVAPTLCATDFAMNPSRIAVRAVVSQPGQSRLRSFASGTGFVAPPRVPAIRAHHGAVFNETKLSLTLLANCGNGVVVLPQLAGGKVGQQRESAVDRSQCDFDLNSRVARRDRGNGNPRDRSGRVCVRRRCLDDRRNCSRRRRSGGTD